MEWGTYYMAPFSNRAFTSFSITRTCWGATSVENTPINLGGRDPNCIWYPFSIVCRTQRDIFGRSFHAVKILLEVPAFRDWFLDLYVVVQSEWHPEMANRQEASELTALKPSSEGAGIPRPLRFRVDPEICARRRPLRPEALEVAGLAEQSSEDTEGRRTPVKLGVDRSTWGGGVLICLSPRASGLLPRSFLKNNNGPQIRFILRRLRLTVLPMSPLFRWGSTISHSLVSAAR